MVIEIKEELENVPPEQIQRNIKLLKYINSYSLSLEDTEEDIDDFDYYKIIEKNDGETFIIMCWDVNTNLKSVCLYIATYED